MDEQTRQSKRIEALEAQNARLRSDIQRLWSARERVWEGLEPLLGVGTWVWEVASREIDWSRNLFRILGFDPEVTPVHEAAEAFDSHIHPDDLENYLEGQERALRGDTEKPVRFRFVRPDGRVVHVALTYSPVRDESGAIVAFSGAIVDMSDRAEAEVEMLRSGRLEAVGRLAGGVAHDFNNLLTIVSCNAELLLLEEPERVEALQILDAAEVGASLTGQLLSFSSEAPGAPVTIALDAVVARTAQLVERLLRDDIRVRIDLRGDGKQIKVDAGQLQTAIVNLAVNARDAMPIGGELEFRTRVVETPASVGQPPSSHVVLSVTDTGVGMDEATLAKIFEPFFTTKHGAHGPKGTGLGLATVRTSVAEAGGEIRARSKLGGGTTIELQFPTARAAAKAPVEEQVEEQEPTPLAKGEVLVVEDAPGIRRVLTTILTRAGLEPLVYSSADEALADWPRLKHRVRVLITDVVMPGRSGRVLANELRRDRPDLGVVIVTGYDPEGSAVEGAVLLRKPFTRAQLIQAIHRVSPARVANGDRS